MTEPWRSLWAALIGSAVVVVGAWGWGRFSSHRHVAAYRARDAWLRVHAPDAGVTCTEGGGFEPMTCDITHPHFSGPVKLVCGASCGIAVGK